MNRTLPDGIMPFLRTAGWADCSIEPIPADASFRRYFRVRAKNEHGGYRTAMLMDAPPPHEDTGPFLDVARWLHRSGHRAPLIHAEDREHGLVLLEDFGDYRMRDWLDQNQDLEEETYRHAIDALVSLHRSPPGPFAAYDLATYQREVRLFTDWYCAAMQLDAASEGYAKAWDEVLAPVLERQKPGVTVLRDYHAENIMLLHAGKGGGGEQGLIDFQDALVGHRAYDLVSLLQDARRDVSCELERKMLDHYLAQTDAGPEFEADYTVLGAQRNAKIVGIFARLWIRDGKPRYLGFIPRVWKALERDLEHPALGPVAKWFDANIPQDIRDSLGGELQ